MPFSVYAVIFQSYDTSVHVDTLVKHTDENLTQINLISPEKPLLAHLQCFNLVMYDV